MTKKTEPIDYPKGLTFEQVWAAIQELGKKYDAIFEREARERQEREEREARERQEWRKEIEKATQEAAESINKAGRLVASLSKEFRNLGNRFGDLVEHLVAPGIAEQFRKLGYPFEDATPPFGLKFYEHGKVIAQVDVLLENNKTIALIEIKANPNIEDIKKHLERMKILRQYYNQDPDKANKELIGAVAGAVFHKEVKNIAVKSGFYVFTQSGDTIKLNVPKDFKPRIF